MNIISCFYSFDMCVTVAGELEFRGDNLEETVCLLAHSTKKNMPIETLANSLNSKNAKVITNHNILASLVRNSQLFDFETDDTELKELQDVRRGWLADGTLEEWEEVPIALKAFHQCYFGFIKLAYEHRNKPDCRWYVLFNNPEFDRRMSDFVRSFNPWADDIY
jgi:hypothetical protein